MSLRSLIAAGYAMLVEDARRSGLGLHEAIDAVLNAFKPAPTAAEKAVAEEARRVEGARRTQAQVERMAGIGGTVVTKRKAAPA